MTGHDHRDEQLFSYPEIPESMSHDGQSLYERIRNTDLTDRSRWSAPINDNPREHFRRMLKG